MTTLVFYLLVFLGIGIFFLFFHLVLGSLIRPAEPEREKKPEKLTIYECGEPTVGSAWIQFDLRYYVVALLFVIFDVEVAFFFPWAVVFGSANKLAQESVPALQREALSRDLLPSSIADQTVDTGTAYIMSLTAFVDILIFFGVLMVGFAYLWRRGDIDWVRSTAAERAAAPPPEEFPRATEALAGTAVRS